MLTDPSGDERQLLRNVAYRLLGSMDDAEDMVQETYLRWHRLDEEARASVRSPRAWKVRVASRLCLDHLGSARVRRECYTGVWLPEPVPPANSSGAAVSAADPADRVTLDESVSMALLVLLDTVTPAERVAFVLHDVFAMPYADIAQTVGRSPEACRQLAASARKRIAGGRGGTASRDEHERVVTAFVQACTSGDVNGLAAVLAPGVIATSDSGGKMPSALHPVVGATKVARLLLGIVAVRPATTFAVGPVNGLLGIIAREAGRIIAVAGLAVSNGTVIQLWIVSNPDKLTRWNSGQPARLGQLSGSMPCSRSDRSE